jgi:LPXTG-site transpeptidase (sortase) family protein
MEPLKPSKYAIVERIATWAAVLIWVGVLLVGAGLTVTYLNVRAEQEAIVQAESFSFVVADTVTPTASPAATVTSANTPTRAPTLTLTPLRPTPTSDYVAPYVRFKDPDILPGAATLLPEPTAMPVASPSVTLAFMQEERRKTGLPESPTPGFTPSHTPAPTVQLDVYDEVSTPRGGVPANAPPDRIVIPSINLNAPVVPIGWHVEEQNGQTVSVWDVPDSAAGWHKTSAYPGNAGNVVLNGHHNIRGEVFRYLIDLEPGARVLLYAGDTAYHYSVAEKRILKERGEPPEVRYQNAQWIAPTTDERLTLVTCWPYTSNTHRLIIVARPYQPDRSKLQ